MTTNDSQLRQMFVRATDELIPPAPWLEAQVVDAMGRRPAARTRLIDLGAFRGFGPSLRLTAGVIAVLVALVAVAALLMSGRHLQHSSVPAGRASSVQSPGIIPFTPSPAVRGADWPAGGPVPLQLAGSWQQSIQSAPVLYLAAYSFQLGEETNGPNIDPLAYGNVVVNGSEIDFISDACSLRGDFGFERYTYVLNGASLTLTRKSGAGQTNCGGGSRPYWPYMAGSYVRIASS
jgi:hypothetical protein